MRGRSENYNEERRKAERDKARMNRQRPPQKFKMAVQKTREKEEDKERNSCLG